MRPHLPDAVISSVNWAEVVQKCVARNVRVEGLRGDLESLGMQVLPFLDARFYSYTSNPSARNLP